MDFPCSKNPIVESICLTQGVSHQYLLHMANVMPSLVRAGREGQAQLQLAGKDDANCRALVKNCVDFDFGS